MALTLSDVLAAVTQSTYWTRLTAAFDKAKVPWKSWPLRSPYLAVSKFVTQALSEGSQVVAYLASGMFLDYAERDALTLFAKSQYQLDRTPAQFTTGRILLTAVPGSPNFAVTAGQLQVGTPGPTASSKIYTNTEAGTLYSSQTLLLDFSATEAGDSYNLPSSTNLDLKTSLAGVTVSNPPSGPPVRVGVGNSSLVFYAAQAGVTVSIVNNGPNLPLAVSYSVGLKAVYIQLRTSGFGVAVSTAEEVRALVKFNILPPNEVGTLLIECKIGGDGTGIVSGTASPVSLPFYSTWIQSPGSTEEDDDSLKSRCRLRWPTLGGGAGDGSPVAPVGTTDALEFWARQTPTDYAASPVKYAKVYSNLDPFTGTASGGVIAVYVAGAAGALSSEDVTAVSGNFLNPKKFAYGNVLHTLSATNLVVALVGTVNVRIASGATTASVSAQVAEHLATYPIDIGITLYPANLAAHINAANFSAIRDVVLTAPSTPVVCLYNQIPVFNLSGLVYVLV